METVAYEDYRNLEARAIRYYNQCNKSSQQKRDIIEAINGLISANNAGLPLDNALDNLRDTAVKSFDTTIEHLNPLPDYTEPIIHNEQDEKAYTVQVTTISITPHVKELIAMLEPDTQIEAVLYEKCKAVITQLSAKLAVLKQAAQEAVLNWSYIMTPDGDRTMGKLRYLLHTLNAGFRPVEYYQDPVGVLSLKVKILQIAAYAVIDAWGKEGQAVDIARAKDAVAILALTLKQTSGERKPNPENLKDLQP